MASKYLRKYRVPEDFKDILIEVIRNVLKDQPRDIELYCWQYFYAKQEGKEFIYSQLMEQQLLKEMFSDDHSQELVQGTLEITNIQVNGLQIDPLDLETSKIYVLAFLSSYPQGLYKTDEIESTDSPNFAVNLNFPIQMTLAELAETQLILQFYDAGNQKQLLKEEQIDIAEIIEQDMEEIELGEEGQNLKIQCKWIQGEEEGEGEEEEADAYGQGEEQEEQEQEEDQQ